MKDTMITPEERQRRVEVNKIRDYEEALKTLESHVKSITKERDTLKEALRYISNINDEYFTIHQEHNERLFTLRDNIDAVIDTVRPMLVASSTSAAKD